MSEDIYREIILDHYRNPRNKGRISDADVSFHDSNPLCGDEIDIHLKVEDNIVKDIKFEGRGCAISQASASMLTEMVMNKPLTSVKELDKDDILENIGSGKPRASKNKVRATFSKSTQDGYGRILCFKRS